MESQEPRKGQRLTCWSFDRMKRGSMFRGWIAGPLLGVNGHRSGQHKPCYSVMTDGKLDCPYCAKGTVEDFLAYVPLYHESGKPTCVGIRRHSLALVQQIPIFDAVHVSREDDEFAPVLVQQKKWDGPYLSGKKEREQPANIKRWLLRFWGLEDLAAWCEEHMQLDVLPKMTDGQKTGVRNLAKLTAEQERAKTSEVIRGNFRVTSQSKVEDQPIGEWMPNYTGKNGKPKD